MKMHSTRDEMRARRARWEATGTEPAGAAILARVVPAAIPDFAPTGPAFFCHTPVDREGLASYTHAIRSPDDPQRSPRPEGGQDDRQPHLTTRKTPVAEWRERLAAAFADGTARTFNRACIEMLDQTADMQLGGPVDLALWQLVSMGQLEHTMEAPILFRRCACDCG